MSAAQPATYSITLDCCFYLPDYSYRIEGRMTKAELIKRLKELQRHAGDVMHAKIKQLIADLEEK